MAASGYSPISLYYSTTASATPTNTNLVNGELALNITDGKLFYKDNAGTVQTLATKAATSGSFSTTTISTSETLSYGTANGVAYLNGSKVVTTGSALTFDGTNLGVNSPILAARTLSVKGRAAFTATANDSQLAIYSDGSTNGLYSTYNSTGSYLPMTFWINDAEQMRLTSTGLGIGTSSPVAKLDVLKTPSDTISRTNAAGGFGDWASLGAGLLMQQTLSSPYGFALQAANAANSVQFPLLLNPSGGNVGIGTSSPVAKLHVKGATNGNLLVRGGASAASGLTGTALSSINDAASATVSLTFEGSDFNFVENNAVVAKLDSSGNLGIGTSSPSQLLQARKDQAAYTWMRVDNQTNSASAYAGLAIGANGNTWGITVGSSAANSNALNFVLDATGTNASKMTLDSSGNLGLGVTPSAWWSSTKTIQVGAGGVISGRTDTAARNYFASNAYLNSSPAWTYIATNYATRYEQNDGQHQFYTAPSGTAGNAISFTQAMTLDASGNLLLGTTNILGSSKVTVLGSGGTKIRVSDTTNTSWRGYTMGVNDNTDYAYMLFNANSGELQIQSGPNSAYGGYITFLTAGTERARIDSSGNLLVGKTSVGASNVGFQLNNVGEITVSNTATTNAGATQLNVYSTGASAYRFYVGMGGTIYATSTTITAISDQRLKENIQDIDVGLNAIMALKPRKFDWKAGKGKDIKGDRGWIAQEFEQVFPDLIDEWKDPAPEGEEPYKAVRADLIPVLVKAIQEQQTLITQLTERITALEFK